MCLAIYKPKGVVLDDELLSNGFENNSDGAGFTIHDDGKLRTYKGFWKWKDFYRSWLPWQEHAALIHFRIGTSGKKNKDNCHPFMIDNRYSVVHNGVLNIKCTQNKMSDTWHFTKLVLMPILNSMPWKHGAMVYLVEQAIGRGNKIAVMSKEGKVMIFNEDEGNWHQDAWFSNHSYNKRSYSSSSYDCSSSSKGYSKSYPSHTVGYTKQEDSNKDDTKKEDVEKETPNVGKTLALPSSSTTEPLSAVAWKYWKRLHCGAPTELGIIDFEGEQHMPTEEEKEISTWIEELQKEAGIPLHRVMDEETEQKIRNLIHQ